MVWEMDQDWLRVFSGTDTHADGLLIGCAVGLLASFERPDLTPRMRRWMTDATVGALGTAGALVLLPPLPFGFFAVAGDLLAVIATAAIVVPVEVYPSSGPVSRWLSIRPLVAVGAISYGLYLWHVPIWILLVDLGYGSPALPALLTFLAAAISYRYVERPFLRARITLGRAGPDSDRPVDAVPVAG
jgi:peptidoglycan/LPS O-acetylase OafA/YrhL